MKNQKYKMLNLFMSQEKMDVARTYTKYSVVARLKRRKNYLKDILVSKNKYKQKSVIKN